METRIVSFNDLDQLVNIHIDAFQGFFLTELGYNFLKTYYNSIRKNKEGILLGCYERNKLIGFCAATISSKGFNKKLILTNFFNFLQVGLTVFIRKPNAIFRLYKNLTKTNTDFVDSGDYAELLSIGVDPKIQGKGIGKKLLLDLECILLKHNARNISLTTDYYNNKKSLEFYKSLNYSVMYDFITYPNRRMYRLIKSL